MFICSPLNTMITYLLFFLIHLYDLRRNLTSNPAKNTTRNIVLSLGNTFVPDPANVTFPNALCNRNFYPFAETTLFYHVV